MGIMFTLKQRMVILLSCLQLIGGAAFSAPLSIAVEDDAAPWSQRDGTGYANDVVRAAFAAQGVAVELSVVPYARCKDMALKGRAVACFTMSWLPEFAGRIVFADEPLFLCYTDYFTGSARPLKATGEEELPRGTTVGIVSGYEYPPSVYSLQERGVVVFEESESEELNLKKLAKGRIDAALVNYNETKPAELLLARAGVSGQVKRAFRGGVLRSFIGFSTKHPQGVQALDAFNKGHRLIATDGTRKTIERKWQDLAMQELASLTGNKLQ